MQEFFFDGVAHHPACNLIKKRLHHRCFTVNFAKVLKALCKSPPLSVADFNTRTYNLSFGPDISRFSAVVAKKQRNFE